MGYKNYGFWILRLRPPFDKPALRLCSGCTQDAASTGPSTLLRRYSGHSFIKPFDKLRRAFRMQLSTGFGFLSPTNRCKSKTVIVARLTIFYRYGRNRPPQCFQDKAVGPQTLREQKLPQKLMGNSTTLRLTKALVFHKSIVCRTSLVLASIITIRPRLSAVEEKETYQVGTFSSIG